MGMSLEGPQQPAALNIHQVDICGQVLVLADREQQELAVPVEAEITGYQPLRVRIHAFCIPAKADSPAERFNHLEGTRLASYQKLSIRAEG